MRLRYFLSVISILVVSKGLAQNPQDWYKQGETYLKIKVAEDGFYKLDLESPQILEVKEEGAFPHLIYHGKEVPVNYVQGPSPYLEFYAEKNKGALDSLVYQNGVARANPYVPLFSESSSYFLFWDETPSSLWKEAPLQSAALLPFVKQHKSIVYDSQYSFNNSIGLLPLLQQSEYENGEGWTGSFISMDSSYTLSLPLIDLVNSSDSIKVQFQLNGRSRNAHLLRWYIDGELQSDTLRIAPFGILIKEIAISKMQGDAVSITFEGIKQAEFDWFSVTYVNWTYPSSKPLAEGDIFSSEVQGTVPFNGRMLQLITASEYLEVPKNAQNRYFIEAKKKYQLLEIFKTPQQVEVFKPKLFSSNADYVILTHESLAEGCMKIRDYRESKEGGFFRATIVYTNDIYNHFNYGERSPIAIRNYGKWLLDQGVQDPYLYLVGRAVTFPDVLKSWEDRDLVPSFGYPASDAFLTAGLNPSLGVNIPAFATGRLNVTSNSEIERYLKKVVEHESQEGDRGWQKNFLHLSGGRSVSELDQLSSMLEGLEPIADTSLWQPSIQSFRKRTLVEVEPIDISEQVNEGVGMITFAGHGSANVLDLNIGYADTPESGLSNKGRYPIMYFNGCGVGNVFYRYDPLSTDWLLAEDRGAIAVFANSFWSYLFSSQLFLQNYYTAFLGDSESVNLRIGQIHQRINQKLNGLAFNPFVKANINQVVLQGDPALQYFDISKPDYKIKQGSIRVSSLDPGIPLGSSSKVKVSFEVENVGRVDLPFGEKDINVLIDRVYTKNILLSKMDESISVSFLLSNFENVFGDKENGSLSIPVHVNLQRELDELNYDNNSAELIIENWEDAKKNTNWPISSGVDELAPILWLKFQNKFIPDGDLVAPSSQIDVFLRDENPLNASDSELKISLSPCSFCTDGFINQDRISFTQVDDYTLKASFIGPSQQGAYNLTVSGSDRSKNQTLNNAITNFKVSGNIGEDSFHLSPNPTEGFLKVAYFLNDVQNPISTEIQMINSKGQVVITQAADFTVGTNEVFVDMSSFSAGVYILRVELVYADKLVEKTRRVIRR